MCPTQFHPITVLITIHSQKAHELFTKQYAMQIIVANNNHIHFAEKICQLIEQAAKERGTGIAKRSLDYISSTIAGGKAVVALEKNQLAGFCYIESWGHEKFVAHSGLVVHPDFRKSGLAKIIKKKIFNLSKEKIPEAKVFGITTSLAVMKINASLGYKPVTFSELTDDQTFWKGCQSCKNFDILTRTNQAHCLCTGMLFDPNAESNSKKKPTGEQWEKFKRFVKYKKTKVKRKLTLMTFF